MTERTTSATARTGHQPGTRRRSRWRLWVPLALALAGLLFATSGLNADGTDLRPDNSDLRSLVEERTERVAAMRDDANELRDQIDGLSSNVGSETVTKQRRKSAELRGPAGLTEVTGQGLRVTLTDAPREVDVAGLDPNLLVVHQQDIQAFVNAMWAGGARAMTLQGQRLISTIGIKCVGNTVVLDGIPYSPPYVIEAIGGPAAMSLALEDSVAVTTYKEYADRYQLGLEVERSDALKAPAYDGTLDLRYAKRAS